MSMKSPSATQRLAPTCSFDILYHVGKLTGSPYTPHDSLEGHGLSVSLFPEAWRQIARLGGAPCWKISCRGRKPEFLDALSFLADPFAVHDLMNWAVTQQLASPATLYRVLYVDESDREYFMLFSDRDEALAETDDPETVTCQQGWIPSDFLLQKTKYRKAEPCMATELVMLVYADEVLGLDGVYWDEELDPAQLSAPRGCIFPSRLDRWIFELQEP